MSSNMEYFLAVQSLKEPDVLWEDIEEVMERIYFKNIDDFFVQQEKILGSSFREIFPGLVVQEYMDYFDIPTKIFWWECDGEGGILLDERTNEIYSLPGLEEVFSYERILYHGNFAELGFESVALLKDVIGRFIAKQVGFADLKVLLKELY